MYHVCTPQRSWFGKARSCEHCGRKPHKLFWNLIQDEKIVAQVSEETLARLRKAVLTDPRAYASMAVEAFRNLVFSLSLVAKAGPIIFFWLGALALAAGPSQVRQLLEVLDVGPLKWTEIFLSGWFLTSASLAAVLGLIAWLWRDGLRLRHALRKALIRKACDSAGVPWTPATKMLPDIEIVRSPGAAF